MGATDDVAEIGRLGMLRCDVPGVEFEVQVQDVRWAYGQKRYVICPSVGAGTAVVGAERVRLIEET